MLNELIHEHRDEGPVLVAVRVGGVNVPLAVRFELPVADDADQLMLAGLTFAASFGSTRITIDGDQPMTFQVKREHSAGEDGW